VPIEVRHLVDRSPVPIVWTGRLFLGGRFRGAVSIASFRNREQPQPAVYVANLASYI
jgi:hypothetical protein